MRYNDAMRIGIDIRCLMDGGRTGVEEYTLGVLRAMFEQDHEDTFVLFANSRKPMNLPSFSYPNVELRTFNYPNKFFNTLLKVAKRPYIDRLLGVDVLFVPSVRLAPVSRLCPLVVTFHDLSFVRHPHYFSWKRRIWHLLMNPKQLAAQAKTVIAVSQATADDVQELYGTAKEKLYVIPSGISPNMRRVLPNSEGARHVKKRYGLPEKFILFLGTLEPRKNLNGLLSAYNGLRNDGFPHKLVIAGVRGWIGDDFFNRVKNSDYARDILFTGFVYDEDKPALYSLADLFVYPSYYEGFGFPPLEALGCGTPVVTSFNSAIPEVVGDWALLVNPYDPNELYRAMAERLKNPVTIISETSEEVRQKYSWQKAGSETLKILKQALR